MAERRESFIVEDVLARMRRAQEDHPATEHTSAGGWCIHCGCGNNILGYKHLPNCKHKRGADDQ